jgi:hypothetical protein
LTPEGATRPRYEVVLGDAAAAAEQVVELAARNEVDIPASRYAKYYLQSPSGSPLLFLARDASTGSVAGMSTVLPWTLRGSGNPVRAGLMVDFIVDASHRGFGPALLLQRTVLSLLADSRFDVLCGTPNQSAAPLFDRLKYPRVGSITRHFKILNVGFAVERKYGRKTLARTASAVLDRPLGFTSRERRHRLPGHLRLERPAAFDDRFDGLWDSHAASHPLVVERTASLLNWRYDLTPEGGSSGHSIVALCTGDEVVAYAVFDEKETVRRVFDLVSLDSAEVADALVAELVRDARGHGAAAVSFLYLGGENALTRSLGSFGFMTRNEDWGLIARTREDSPLAPLVADEESWYFTVGDTDF